MTDDRDNRKPSGRAPRPGAKKPAAAGKKTGSRPGPRANRDGRDRSPKPGDKPTGERRSRSDKPRREGAPRKTTSDTRPKRGSGDRPSKPGDKPTGERRPRTNKPEGNRPPRPRGAKPGLRPKRDERDRPAKPGDKPAGDRRSRSGKPEGNRPPRRNGAKPGFRPKRDDRDRPARPDGKPAGQRRSRTDKPDSDRTSRPKGPGDGRPKKPFDRKPRSDDKRPRTGGDDRGRFRTKPDTRPAPADERPQRKPESGKKREPRLTPAGNVVRVWRQDRDGRKQDASGQETAAAEKSEIAETPVAPEKPNEPVAEDTQKKKVLWFKGTDPAGKPVAVKPPAGFEKHRDTPRIADEELDAIESRITGEFQRRMAAKKRDVPPRRERPAHAAATAAKAGDKEEMPQEAPIEVIYTISLERTPLQRFIQRLVDAGVRMVIDIRTDDAMQAHGLAKARDLAILLKEAAGIEYRQEEVLVPRREIWAPYQSHKNWSLFSSAYVRQLDKMRAPVLLNRALFAKIPVALIGEGQDAEHDYRTLAAKYLQARWGITSIIAL
jgi:hypothetical protein